ncbi:hypothetical protein T440DRAFT_251511 [Plenodomus tracheiphilus IPT5]|uniref:Uncharacterized protein n=1 Tax=Plenodomus tracheiphilus IPT5 TaxID=1408161 RepID=A0A6A7AVA6_9PLEO|nr:hypothetical protein T440DRAFT_251511 [Plenodomus tracheiphilus IPT5]
MLFKFLALLGFLCMIVFADNSVTNITASDLYNGTIVSGSTNRAPGVHGWCTFHAKVWEQCYDQSNTNIYLRLSYVRDEHGNEIPGLGRPVSGEVSFIGDYPQWTEMEIYGNRMMLTWKGSNHIEYMYGTDNQHLKTWRDNEGYQCKRRSDWGPGRMNCKSKFPLSNYRVSFDYQ